MRLYVHVPFCARRCSYCDFSIAVRRATPVEEFLVSVRSELAIRVRDRLSLASVYLGGGTPSRLGGEGIARLLDDVQRHADVEEGAEVTMEANPDDVTADAVRVWRASGVTRLSLGVQSFDDRALSWMHRAHEAAQVQKAVDSARAGGIEEFSVDLIFALPDAVGRHWRTDLETAVALEPAHISLYGLTVESGTPLGRWTARGEVAEAPEERYEEEFLLAHEVLTSAGLEHYEVSNYARPGQRARHNSAYWAREPYMGIGPSAHSFTGSERRWNVDAYARWQHVLAEHRDPLEEMEVLTPENVAAETVYLALRTLEGLPMRDEWRALADPWITAGWARISAEGRLQLTPSGWLRLDAIAASLTAFSRDS